MIAHSVKLFRVKNCRTVGRADGRVVFVFETKELGLIGFDVDQQAIDMLRRTIATAEVFLRNSNLPKPPQ